MWLCVCVYVRCDSLYVGERGKERQRGDRPYLHIIKVGEGSVMRREYVSVCVLGVVFIWVGCGETREPMAVEGEMDWAIGAHNGYNYKRLIVSGVDWSSLERSDLSADGLSHFTLTHQANTGRTHNHHIHRSTHTSSSSERNIIHTTKSEHIREGEHAAEASD
ncbi:hypothetical protein WMY93_005926 [Mugilogobius chulae]|uniref:Uncharacterized protein n=1 Tax=Mugilogobius chulae TaxID=88201 RepID=A0AAW0PUG2_9GOBI